MKAEKYFYMFDVVKAEGAVKSYLDRFNDFQKSTKRFHSVAIKRFLSFVRKKCADNKEFAILSDSEIRKWAEHVAETTDTCSTYEVFMAVDRFLQSLVDKEIISKNPMKVFKMRFGKHGWRGITLALKSKTPKSSLMSLRVEPSFIGDFGRKARAYIDLHHAVGAKYISNELLLSEFNHFIHKRSVYSVQSVTTQIIQEWIYSTTGGRNQCRTKLFFLKRFFDHLVTMGILNHSPVVPSLIESLDPRDRSFRPYIFTRDQIALLIQEARKLPPNNVFRLRNQIVYIIIGMLYTLGLRISEVTNLRIQDVDFSQGTIFIRKSKFYKDRLLPLGPRLCECLKKYLEVRSTIFAPVRPDDPLFPGRQRFYVTTATIGYIFRDLLKTIGINLTPDQRRPRLHDLRHTFAVHRLLQWYKEGADVQSKLVLLSTFMGHVDIYSTQVYLTITDDLLNEANKRFYDKFGSCFEKEISL